MSENALKLKLEEICQKYEIERFQADEIWEMLADGEDVDWLVGMVTENKPAAAGPLKEILSEIGELVKPVPATVAPEPETMAGPEPAPDDEAAVSSLAGIELPPGTTDAQFEEMLNSPYGLIMGDFVQFCQEKGIDITQFQDDQKALRPYMDQWMDEPRPAFEGKTPRTMVEQNPDLINPGKVETFRRDQPKVGRNDPCPCGSGKKYKKCCGREE